MKLLEERFWEKVKKTKSCWNWTAHLNKDGYGKLSINNKHIRAHRVSWELHNGAIPNKMNVLHKCDNPACVNPNHLFLGTFKDNSQDMKNKNRHFYGEKNTEAKLTEKQVLEIRHLYSLGNISHKKLAKLYNISKTQIGGIIRRVYWGHI